MNPSSPPATPPGGSPRSSFRRILTGILIGIAPMPVALFTVTGVSKSSQVMLVLFVGAVICSLIGGAMVAMASSPRLSVRIVIGLHITLGLLAINVAGGFFLGCLIAMGPAV